MPHSNGDNAGCKYYSVQALTLNAVHLHLLTWMYEPMLVTSMTQVAHDHAGHTVSRRGRKPCCSKGAHVVASNAGFKDVEKGAPRP